MKSTTQAAICTKAITKFTDITFDFLEDFQANMLSKGSKTKHR
jgi:hypothetical protein